MKKIRIVENALDNGAGSKGQFVLNDKAEKIRFVETTGDVAVGRKGQFAINIKV